MIGRLEYRGHCFDSTVRGSYIELTLSIICVRDVSEMCPGVSDTERILTNIDEY